MSNIYVYSKTPKDGLEELIEGLGAKRLRHFDGLNFRKKGRVVEFEKDDAVVCWGSQIPQLEDVLVLNGGVDRNPLQDFQTLDRAGVRIVPYRSGIYGPIPSDWFGRKFGNSADEDLLTPADRKEVGFYVYKLQNVSKVITLHSFDGRSIKAGLRVPRDGVVYDQYIRSSKTGWKVDYQEFQSDATLRKLVLGALKALGLTFGAVNVIYDENNYSYVIGVNRSPELNADTIPAYTRAIMRWVKEQTEMEKVLEARVLAPVEGLLIPDYILKPKPPAININMPQGMIDELAAVPNNWAFPPPPNVAPPQPPRGINPNPFRRMAAPPQYVIRGGGPIRRIMQNQPEGGE